MSEEIDEKYIRRFDDDKGRTGGPRVELWYGVCCGGTYLLATTEPNACPICGKEMKVKLITEYSD